MKKMIYLLFISAFIMACNDEKSFELKEDGTPKPTGEIVVKNGMLVFPDAEVFAAVREGKMLIPFHLGFISQKELFHQVVLAEEAYAKEMKDETNPELLYSELYKEKLKSGLIKESKLSDGAVLYDLNLLFPNYSTIVNEKGFFAIGSDIYMVSSNALKCWVDGDFDNYRLLEETITSDEERGITVFSEDKIQTKAFVPFTASELNKMVCHSSSTTRFYIHMFDNAIYNPRQPDYYTRETYARVVAQKKSGSKWIYITDFPYTFWVRYSLEDEVGNWIYSFTKRNETIGYNDYYDMWFMTGSYGMNKVPESEGGPIRMTTDYIYIGNVEFYLTGRRATDNCSTGYLEFYCTTQANKSRYWRFYPVIGTEEVYSIPNL